MSHAQYEAEVLAEQYEKSENVGFADIWKTLSKINLEDKVKPKGRLKYLSWAWAWGKVMEYYPGAAYKFLDLNQFTDGSCEVWVEVDIHGNKRQMWLAVMDYQSNAVLNPTSTQIANTRMRCLTKCLAMFGLGHYIYAGEDLPDPEMITDDQSKEIVELAQLKGVAIEKITTSYGVSNICELFASSANDAIIKLRNKPNAKQGEQNV